MKKKLILPFLLLVFIAAIAGVAVFKYYPYIFARDVIGQVVNVDRVMPASTIIQSGARPPDPQVFSFAIAIKDRKTGEIVTASSEDRQWAVVRAGQCAEAKYFPYEPWDLNSAGTYHNARLMKLSECDGTVAGAPTAGNAPAAPAASPPAAPSTPAPGAGI